VTQLRRAAILAFVTHLIAGACMALILREGLETNPDLQARLEFLTNHRVLWMFAWLTWTAAALAILYFYDAFSTAHQLSRYPVLLTAAALPPDLTAQVLEIGILPMITDQIDLFLIVHRAAVLMSGYLANGLYSLSALLLAWTSRHAYPVWVWTAGLAVSLFGLMLSVAALAGSTAGMFWTNVFLLPAILLWLAGVAYSTWFTSFQSDRHDWRKSS
jgi:hypothetical protein